MSFVMGKNLRCYLMWSVNLCVLSVAVLSIEHDGYSRSYVVTPASQTSKQYSVKGIIPSRPDPSLGAKLDDIQITRKDTKTSTGNEGFEIIEKLVDQAARNLRLNIIGQNRNVTLNLTSLVVLGLGVAAAVSFFNFFDSQQQMANAQHRYSSNYHKRSFSMATEGRFVIDRFVDNDQDEYLTFNEDKLVTATNQSKSGANESLPIPCTERNLHSNECKQDMRTATRIRNTIPSPKMVATGPTEASKFDIP